MNSSAKGFDYERQVKDHFVKAGWGCTRAAHSASAIDLVAFKRTTHLTHPRPYDVFKTHGYTIDLSKSTTIPLKWLASKIEDRNIKHVYYERVSEGNWTVVLMQCKIFKRLKRKKRKKRR